MGHRQPLDHGRRRHADDPDRRVRVRPGQLVAEDLDHLPKSRGVDRVPLAGGPEHVEVPEAAGQGMLDRPPEDGFFEPLVVIPRTDDADHHGARVASHAALQLGDPAQALGSRPAWLSIARIWLAASTCNPAIDSTELAAMCWVRSTFGRCVMRSLSGSGGSGLRTSRAA